MNTVIDKLSPGITKMIRTDHAHVLTTFHRYDVDAPAATKRSIADAVCLALEIHAQLEEEIFYPALREVAAGDEALAKAQPEHEEMKRLIGVLRDMEPTDDAFDARFLELMRDVMHHVADEETVLLPAAELLLHDRLGELGMKMTKRRVKLAAPHAGELALGTVRAVPASGWLMAGSLLAGGYLLGRAFEQRRSPWR